MTKTDWIVSIGRGLEPSRYYGCRAFTETDAAIIASRAAGLQVKDVWYVKETDEQFEFDVVFLWEDPQ